MLRGNLIYSLSPNPVSNSSLEGPPLISIRCALTLLDRARGLSLLLVTPPLSGRMDMEHLQLDALYVELEEPPTD